METMPHHLPGLERDRGRAWIDGAADAPDWRQGLPVLLGLVMLRELTEADAVPLAEQLTTEEVTHFISPPPVDAEGFRRFFAGSSRA